MSLESQVIVRSASSAPAPVPHVRDQKDGRASVRRGVCGECTLLVESDHRIANHFALLIGYVRLKRTEMTRGVATTADPLVLTMIDGIMAQITVLSDLHRSLSRDPMLDIVDISRYLRASCEPFRQGLSGSITFSESFESGCMVQMDEVLPISQIMVEVITNSLKHAHAAQEKGTISVTCTNDPSGDFQLTISDDGVGLPASFKPAGEGGLGFRIVRSLAESLGASIAYVSTGRGVAFQLSLPASRAGQAVNAA